MFDVSGRTSVFCVVPNPLWQKIANVKQSMTIWTSTVLSGLSYKKTQIETEFLAKPRCVKAPQEPHRVRLGWPSPHHWRHATWQARHDSFKSHGISHGKKTNLVNCNQGCLHREIHISFHWISWILWNSSTASTSPKPSESIFWHKKNHSHTSSAADPLHKSCQQRIQNRTLSDKIRHPPVQGSLSRAKYQKLDLQCVGRKVRRKRPLFHFFHFISSVPKILDVWLTGFIL